MMICGCRSPLCSMIVRRVSPRRVDLDPHRLALDDVLVADDAADLGEDRHDVRVPLAEHRAAA